MPAVPIFLGVEISITQKLLFRSHMQTDKLLRILWLKPVQHLAKVWVIGHPGHKHILKI